MEKQYQSENINELAAALAKAQGEMGHAAKASDNPYFKSKYADLPAVIDAAKPALAKHGLSVTQFTDIDPEGKVILIAQLNHSSGQWVRGWYPLNPVKSDPQGLGSAYTYGRRYTFCGLTGVAATGEDDDGNAASGNVVEKKPAKKESAKDKSERYQFIKDSLIGSDDFTELQNVWSAHHDAIKEFQREDQTFYDDLLRTKDDRKVELAHAASYPVDMIKTK